MIFNSTLKKLASTRLRMLARASAVALLVVTLVHGISRGGHLDYDGSPWRNLPGKIASLMGLAAVDIRVSGLTHHDPELLLHALDVRPGGSLIGFDAGAARRQLEAMDWVAAATVQRQYPNRLEITVTERKPFAIWQRNGSYVLIDRAGVAMGGLELVSQAHLPLVTGEGANLAAEDFVNQLEANPLLFKRVSAAAFVGKRRWTLYLDNGIKIALPEIGAAEALAKVVELDAAQGILSKAVLQIDMRIVGQMTVAVAEVESQSKDDPTKLKLSQKQ